MSYVLVVDDDETLASVVTGYLDRAGHRTKHVGDGTCALDTLGQELPDLVVLDLMLPGVDGLEVCRRIRGTTPDLPVLMLTALNETEDRIAGLEVGADDYLAKPFSPRELVLRVDALLRRSRPSPKPPTLIRVGSLTVDTVARRATLDGTELALTIRELDLLAFLLANPGRAFRREELMHEVWGWSYGDLSTVTVHVRRLREKIEEDPSRPSIIQTVWGVGYRLDAPVTVS